MNETILWKNERQMKDKYERKQETMTQNEENWGKRNNVKKERILNEYHRNK